MLWRQGVHGTGSYGRRQHEHTARGGLTGPATTGMSRFDAQQPPNLHRSPSRRYDADKAVDEPKVSNPAAAPVSPSTSLAAMMIAAHEADKEKGCLPIIMPDGEFRKWWDSAQVVALFYVAIMVPIRIGFAREMTPLTAEWFVELLTDIYFIVDIIVNFRTAYYDEDELVVKPSQVAKQYTKGWFAIDVLSCLPVGYVSQIIVAFQESSADDNTSASANDIKALKILRLLRLAKLLRLARLRKVIKRHEENMENIMGYMKLVGATSTIFYGCHLCACLWYLVGEDEHTVDTFSGDIITVEGWRTRRFGGNNFTLTVQYTHAFYWALTTLSTVGYGDITPLTIQEHLFSIACELFGCLRCAMV